jgi:predicted thioesterase
MEQASMQGVVAHLSSGETTVGFEVNVRHLAPADIGDTIVVTAELTEVDRNRLTFRVEAFHGDRKIGEGTHRRAIIQTPA